MVIFQTTNQLHVLSMGSFADVMNRRLGLPSGSGQQIVTLRFQASDGPTMGCWKKKDFLGRAGGYIVYIHIIYIYISLSLSLSIWSFIDSFLCLLKYVCACIYIYTYIMYNIWLGTGWFRPKRKNTNNKNISSSPQPIIPGMVEKMWNHQPVFTGHIHLWCSCCNLPGNNFRKSQAQSFRCVSWGPV